MLLSPDPNNQVAERNKALEYLDIGFVLSVGIKHVGRAFWTCIEPLWPRISVWQELVCQEIAVAGYL